MKQAKMKIVSMILATAMVLALIPVFQMRGWAALSASNIVLDELVNYQIGDGGSNWTYASSVVTINEGATVTISGTSTSQRIAITGNANITLVNVQIDISGKSGTNGAIKINSGKTVNMTLQGDNRLVGNTLGSGIAADGAILNILGSDTGSGNPALQAIGKSNGAGISVKNGGKVTIGGSVEVYAKGGDQYAPGYGINCSGGSVNIKEQATIEAVGGNTGAGIDGSYAGGNGSVTIDGSGTKGVTVIATGGSLGAGISAGDSGTILIRGNSTVTATGGEQGAGIGGNNGFGGGNITIENNARVTAVGGARGSGIGGGYEGAGGIINISGGNITASGGEDQDGTESGAGIGGGVNGDGGEVSISGGKVTATAGAGAQGVGHGVGGSDAGTFTLDGDACVYATSVGAEDAALTLTNGVLFEEDKQIGTVYGSVDLRGKAAGEVVVWADDTLTIPDGTSLAVDKLINQGETWEYGTFNFPAGEREGNLIRTVNKAGAASSSYSEGGINLDEVYGLFTIHPRAGVRTYALKGGTGDGDIEGSILSIRQSGTFEITVATDPSTDYAAIAETAVATLTVTQIQYPTASIPKPYPVLSAKPGQTLADIESQFGVGSKWSWKSGTGTYSVGAVGSNTHQAIYTPEETWLYGSSAPVDITVIVSEYVPELRLEPSPVPADGKVVLTAELLDEDGAPLVGKYIDFIVNGVVVATERTGQDGKAVHELVTGDNSFTCAVEFDGEPGLYEDVLTSIGTYSIARSSQTTPITVSPIVAHLDDVPFSAKIVANVSGGDGSGAYQWGGGNSSIATVDPTTGLVTVHGVGNTTLTVIKLGDNFYNPTQTAVSIPISVTKRQIAFAPIGTPIEAAYSPVLKLSDISLPAGYRWAPESLQDSSPINAGTPTYKVIYNPDPSLYQDSVPTNVQITINPAKITQWDVPIAQPVEGATIPIGESAPATHPQYSVTVKWQGVNQGDVFIADGNYTAIVTVTPTQNYTLVGVAENFFKIKGATTANAAGNGVITAQYPVLSSDSSIQDLTINGETISGFHPDTPNYSLEVESSVGSIVIGVTPNRADAEITGAGTKTMQTGDNIFTVTVLAPDKSSSKMYIITVKRKAGSSGGGGGGGSSGGSSTPKPQEKDTEIYDIPGGGTAEVPKDKAPVNNPDDGSATLPGGGYIKQPNGTGITSPPGTKVDNEGNVQLPPDRGGAVDVVGGGTIDIPGGTMVDKDGNIKIPQNGVAIVTKPDGSQSTVVGPATMGYPDGDLKWKNPYVDVNEEGWYIDNIQYVDVKTLMNGVGKEMFAPDDPMSRAMIVTVLWRANGSPAAEVGSKFSDVGSDKWFSAAVAWAEENGVVKGISEELFAPDEEVTREQMAAIFHRFAQFVGIDADTISTSASLPFEDADNIAEYALKPVVWTSQNGIIKGMPIDGRPTDTMFSPKGNATRAQVAAVLNRFLEVIE